MKKTNKTISATERKRIAERMAESQYYGNDDEGNPSYLFSMTQNDLLVAIANGMIDACQLAKQTLADRGLDACGKWVGYEKSRKVWRV